MNQSVFQPRITWIAFCILGLSFCSPWYCQAQESPFLNDSGVVDSLKPVKSEFQVKFDALDPSALTNPAGAAYPGFRGARQLVVYTPGFGTVTQTNAFGSEAIIENGFLERFSERNSRIPSNGWVISAQGHLGDWLKKTMKPGMAVEIDWGQKRITLQMTPMVYIKPIQTLLDKASLQEAPSDNSQTAETCLQQLMQQAQWGLSPAFIDAADRCKTIANHAYYHSFPADTLPFRGIWVRPTEQTPEAIEQTVLTLKSLHVDHVFLETYFQGTTLYPSEVMQVYGLSKQYGAYQNWDPLKVWIETAHRHGLKVHAWVQTFFAGNTETNLEPYGPILSHYPAWANRDRRHADQSKPVPSEIEPGHFFLDPGHPEVQAFLEKLLLEMVTCYELDGLNLDYIRYPASLSPKVTHYLPSTWGYSAVSRKRFETLLREEQNALEKKQQESLKKQGQTALLQKRLAALSKRPLPSFDPKNLTPQHPQWYRWMDWRQDQVSSFVKTIAEKTHAVRSDLLVSAVVFPSQEEAEVTKLQDWPRWVASNWIQALTPIGLGETEAQIFSDALRLKEVAAGKVPVYPGVFGMYNRVSPEELLAQLSALHRAGLPGVILFDRSRLTPQYEQALQEGPFRR